MNKISIRQLTATTLLWLVASIVASLAATAAYAQGTPNKLESIDVQNLSGQQLQLTLRHAAPPAEPVAFTIDNPARISLDLANTTLALPSRRIDVRAGGVDSVLAAEASGRTRLVLNLDRLMPYQMRVSGNDVIRPDRRCFGLADRRGRRLAGRRWLTFCSAHCLRSPVGSARHSRHRLPPRYWWHRPRDRAPVRSAHAGQPAPARQPDRRRLRRRRSGEQPCSPLRRRRFRDSGEWLRRGTRGRWRSPRDHRHGRLRTARLPV